MEKEIITDKGAIIIWLGKSGILEISLPFRGLKQPAFVQAIDEEFHIKTMKNISAKQSNLYAIVSKEMSFTEIANKVAKLINNHIK